MKKIFSIAFVLLILSYCGALKKLHKQAVQAAKMQIKAESKAKPYKARIFPGKDIVTVSRTVVDVLKNSGVPMGLTPEPAKDADTSLIVTKAIESKPIKEIYGAKVYEIIYLEIILVKMDDGSIGVLLNAKKSESYAPDRRQTIHPHELDLNIHQRAQLGSMFNRDEQILEDPKYYKDYMDKLAAKLK